MNYDIRRALFPMLVVGMLVATVSLWADPPSVVGRLGFVSGSVSFQPGTLDEWSPATVNYPLTAGDHLWTDQGGRAEIDTGSTAIRLDSDTDFSFLTLDDQTQQVRLGSGSINVHVRRLDPGDAFEIDTPNSTITLLVAGSYRVDVQQEGQASQIIVRSGQAEVESGGGSFDVSTGQTGSVSGMGSVAYSVSMAPQFDEWDAWSAARDAREDRLASVRYVSRDMIGIEDLDANGTWVTIAGYGAVWQPTRVAAGWAPYRDGRWAWVEPWGWTWIDEAPWGFAPFHYGRWAYVNARWFWVPGEMAVRPVYAPALVVFVGGDTWRPSSVEGIGWFPLAPREVYVPPYTVSTTYVQRINNGTVTVTVETIQRFDPARVVYMNRTVPQAVTVVPRQAFTQFRPSSVSALSISSAEITRAPVMGMGASLIPQRESVAAQNLIPNQKVAAPPSGVANRPVNPRIQPAAKRVPFTATQQKPAQGNVVVTESPSPAAGVSSSTSGSLMPSTRPSSTGAQSAGTAMTAPAATGSTTKPSAMNPGNQAVQQPGNAPQGSNARAAIAQMRSRDIPAARANLEGARKVRGIKLDFNANSRRLSDIEASLVAADADAAAGRVAQAQGALQNAQRALAEVQRAITDAMRAAQGH